MRERFYDGSDADLHLFFSYEGKISETVTNKVPTLVKLVDDRFFREHLSIHVGINPKPNTKKTIDYRNDFTKNRTQKEAFARQRHSAACKAESNTRKVDNKFVLAPTLHSNIHWVMHDGWG